MVSINQLSTRVQVFFRLANKTKLALVSLWYLSVGCVAHSDFDRPRLTSYKSLCLGGINLVTHEYYREPEYTL